MIKRINKILMENRTARIEFDFSGGYKNQYFSREFLKMVELPDGKVNIQVLNVKKDTIGDCAQLVGEVLYEKESATAYLKDLARQYDFDCDVEINFDNETLNYIEITKGKVKERVDEFDYDKNNEYDQILALRFSREEIRKIKMKQQVEG